MLRLNWEVGTLTRLTQGPPDRYGRVTTTETDHPATVAVMGLQGTETPTGGAIDGIGYIKENDLNPTRADRLTTAGGLVFAIVSVPLWISHPLATAIGQCWRFNVKAVTA